MAILNITPDSFSDGGQYFSSGQLRLDNLLRSADTFLQEGAAILDVGGESTRPGAASVSEQEELDRVIPVIEALVQRFDAFVSVDTSRASVITEAANKGASLINDVRALQLDAALDAAVATNYAAKSAIHGCVGRCEPVFTIPHYCLCRCWHSSGSNFAGSGIWLWQNPGA